VKKSSLRWGASAATKADEQIKSVVKNFVIGVWSITGKTFEGFKIS
jgi:hypothetical protein